MLSLMWYIIIYGFGSVWDIVHSLIYLFIQKKRENRWKFHIYNSSIVERPHYPAVISYKILFYFDIIDCRLNWTETGGYINFSYTHIRTLYTYQHQSHHNGTWKLIWLHKNGFLCRLVSKFFSSSSSFFTRLRCRF